MEKLKELAFFEDLLKTPQNALVEKAVKAGRIPFGYNCCTVPEPLLSVGNAFPVRLRAPQTTSTEAANFYMSSYTCSYSRSILETALNGDYQFLGGLVFSGSCVHIQRAGHNFKILNLEKSKEKFVYHILEAPRKIFAASVEAMAVELRRVAGMISDSYGIDMSEDNLIKAIQEYNQFNQLLQEIANFRKEDNPKITGAEWHTVSVACKVAPKDLLIEPLKRLKAALQKREAIQSDGPRIMILGSVFDNPAFTELIESQGCMVVADRHCFGSLPGLEKIEEIGDPYLNMARHFLENAECPRMMEKSQTRIQHTMQWVEEYKVDGIIFETMKFCDLWGYEVLTAEKGIRNLGMPIVRIEREYQFSGEGQLRTRVQAFIESIQNKKMNKNLAQ